MAEKKKIDVDERFTTVEVTCAVKRRSFVPADSKPSDKFLAGDITLAKRQLD